LRKSLSWEFRDGLGTTAHFADGTNFEPSPLSSHDASSTALSSMLLGPTCMGVFNVKGDVAEAAVPSGVPAPCDALGKILVTPRVLSAPGAPKEDSKLWSTSLCVDNVTVDEHNAVLVGDVDRYLPSSTVRVVARRKGGRPGNGRAAPKCRSNRRPQSRTASVLGAQSPAVTKSALAGAPFGTSRGS